MSFFLELCVLSEEMQSEWEQEVCVKLAAQGPRFKKPPETC